MATEEQPQPDARWLTAVEASLLAFAAYFFTNAALSRLFPEAGARAWLILSLIPPLVLLVGALLIRRRSADLYPISSRQAWLMMASIGALLLGMAGGIWIGPTLPSRLAPLLPAGWAAVWGLVWVGVGAPIIEELFFRGTLQPAIERRIGGMAAVVLSAAAFTLAHYGLPEMVIIGGVGLAAGVAAHLTGCVLPAIALHVGWNLGTVGVSFLDYELASGWPLTLLTVLGLLCLIEARRRHATGRPHP